MDIKETLSANLRKYRKLRGWTQAELGGRCGMHRTYIGRIEQKRINVSIKNVQIIAQALGVDPFLLFAPITDKIPEKRRTRSLRGAPPKDSYALISWSERGTTFRELDTSDIDLTASIVSSLVAEGYSGEMLVTQFHKVQKEIVTSLRSKGL